MSLILNSVRVKNFRAHAEAEVVFPSSGLTTIIGDNGAGKSSLVSIAPFYALYGKAPSGVSLRSLRRQGAPDTEPTVVEVSITIDGKHLEVTRTLKGKNLTSMAEVKLDGVPVTDTKTGAANDLIESLLGAPDAFSTVYLVAQKSLDSLVTAKGADRRRLIERLAGIDSLQQAVDETRARARATKAAVGALPPVPDIDELEQGLETAQAAERVAHQKALDAEAVEKLAREALVAAEEDASGLEQAARSALEKRVEFERLRGDERAAHSLLESALSKLNSLTAPPEAAGEIVETSPLEGEIAGLREEFTRIGGVLSTLPESVDDSELVRIRSLVECCPAGEPVDSAALLASKAVVESQLSAARSSLAVLSDKCPTCGHATDEEAMRKRLEESIQDLSARIESLGQELSLIEEWNDACATAASLQQAYDAAQASHEGQVEAAKQRAALTAQQEEIAKRATLLKEELEETKTRNEAISTWISYTETLEELRSEVQSAESRVSEIGQALSQLGPEPDVNEAAITEARDYLARVREAVASAALETRAAWSEHSSAVAAVSGCQELLSVARELQQRAEAVRSAHRVAASTQDSMERFREERLAMLVPSLRDSGSDYINALSGGRFVGLELSDDFDPAVIDDDGSVREVALLSGGEESLVALALRLAIGDEIVAGSGSMLVLDEILGAMDESRRNLIVESLRRLDRQVVMVDHHGTPGDHTVRIERA